MRHLAGGWQTAVVANIRIGRAPSACRAASTSSATSTIDNPTKGRWFNTCTLGARRRTRNACADAGVDERAADPGRAPLDPAFRVRPANALDTTGRAWTRSA